MTKITIVTDRRGKLIGAVQGHELSQRTGEVQAEVSFEPGHKLHKVDANIDLAGQTKLNRADAAARHSFRQQNHGAGK